MSKMSKWSEPAPKTGRCRLDCGDGFVIREDPLKTGYSYWLIFRESPNKRFWKHIYRSRVQDRDQAYEEHWRYRLQMADGKLSERSSDVEKFSEGIPLYLKSKKSDRLRHYIAIERTMRNRLELFFGEMRLRDITIQNVKEYRDERGETVGDDAILRETVWLKEYFKFMNDLGFMDKNPVDRKKLKLKPAKRDRYMSAKEQQVIWPLLEKYPAMLAVADFALHTAMRPSNITTLTWDKILLNKKRAIVPGELHKQKRDGHYLLNREMVKMLKRLRELNSQNGNSPFVFTRYENGKSKPINIKWIQRIWNEIIAEAGVENLHFYDLKTTCLSRLARKGASLLLLKAVSNHSSTASLERYISDDALKEEALRLMETGVSDWSRKELLPQGRELN